MQKKKLQILLSKLKVKKLNPNDPKVKELIAETIKEQKRVLSLKELDVESLKRTYITI